MAVIGMPGGHPVLVLDTNIVLDLLVFQDRSAASLMQALAHDDVHWLTTEAMRAELERVLAYPHIAARLHTRGLCPKDVLAQYQRLSDNRIAASASTVRCSDPDDQIFIDLAVAHQATLLSKDHAVLRLRKRLAVSGVLVQAAWGRPHAVP